MSPDYTEDDTLPILVDAGAPATVTVTTGAYHRCPFKDEADEGELTLTFEAGAETLELHSLKAWIDGLDEWMVSHEAYTFYIKDQLTKIGVRVTHVTTRWTTADMTVSVSA
jgi:hypothetical protein